MIIPRPKKIVSEAGQFALSSQTTLYAGEDDVCASEARTLVALLTEGTGLRCRVRHGAPQGGIELRRVPRLAGVPDREEGYALHITPERAVLQATTARGLFYAGQSLLDLIEREGDRFTIPACDVLDWPDFRFRGYMADPARYFLPLKRLKWEIDHLARNKFNRFHIHFTDSESFTLPVRRHARLNEVPPGPHGVYSRAEIAELCRYATDRHIQIIPELELPGHARQLTLHHPELKCRPTKGKASEWTICIGSERTYELIERLLGEIVPLFPGNLFHVGTDELEFKDDMDKVFVSWDTCPECQARMKREGLSARRDLFYYFLRRVHGMLAERGKRMMMWNDNIDIAKPHSVPRDVLIHFWRVAQKGRGPWRGCSLGRFVRDGFEVVNSNYPETYFEYNTDERRVRWNPAKVPPIPRTLRKQVIGGTCCAWNNETQKEEWEQALPSSWALFADRVWNRAPIKDTDGFARAVPRHIFGPRTPRELEPLFLALGRISSPPLLSWRPHPSDLPSVTPIATPQRLAMIGPLRQCLQHEHAQGTLMNAPILAQYDAVLERLHTELSKPQA